MLPGGHGPHAWLAARGVAAHSLRMLAAAGQVRELGPVRDGPWGDGEHVAFFASPT